MRTIQSSRFGTVEIEEDRIIHFVDGLLGFPRQRDYTILEHQKESPFCWLQSMDTGELAFVITNPFGFKPDYLQGLSPEEESLFQIEGGGEPFVFNLVTIPPGHVEMATVNLLGPLVIDMTSRKGKQVVLANAGYSHRQPLFRP